MKQKTIVKRVIDIALTVTLLLLMAFQVTEQLAHEWLGITMFVLTIVHQALNRRFYAAVFRGKYDPLRIFQLLVNYGMDIFEYYDELPVVKRERLMDFRQISLELGQDIFTTSYLA
ncbi:MAG: hypothetical protein II615_07225, partial [Ruminococcus sp.]|nr:hypothetical protein [Ruminococcus sp.]